jgi:autotransporter-associated beta strand protein
MSASGAVTVTGGEVRFTGNGPVLSIGRYAGATGTVTVAGGVVDMGGNGSVWMGRFDSGSIPPVARLVLTGTGTLRTRQIFEYVPTSAAESQILFDGGILQASASAALVQPVDDARLTANGMVVDSAGFNISVVPELKDAEGVAGAIVKKGAGTLTLAGERSATGPVSVLGGTLVISNDVAVAAGVSRIDGALTLTAAHRLTVAAGAALAGTGTVARVTLADQAVIARAKSDGAVSPLVAGDCVAGGGVTVALTGYTLPELVAGLPLLRTPTVFVAISNVDVTLNGQSMPSVRASFVEADGQHVFTVKYNAGTLISVQ